MEGPFYHQLNKGGLDDIIRNQRLLSTESRYCGEAVRAYRGKFNADENNTTDNKIFIEFNTYEAPRDGTPAHFAEWRIPEGSYLKIQLLYVYKNGAIIHRFV